MHATIFALALALSLTHTLLLLVGGVLLHELDVHLELIDAALLVAVGPLVGQPLLLHPRLLVPSVPSGPSEQPLGVLRPSAALGGVLGILVAIPSVARIDRATDHLLPVRAGGGSCGGGGDWPDGGGGGGGCSCCGGAKGAGNCRTERPAEDGRYEPSERHYISLVSSTSTHKGGFILLVFLLPFSTT